MRMRRYGSPILGLTLICLESQSHSAAEELRGFAHIQLAKRILIGVQQYPPWRMYLAAAAMARLSNIWNIK